MPQPGENPFSTRFIRPGALAYVFPPGASAETLVARLAAAHWRGQIIGPHGSGKTALLAELRTALSAAGRNSALLELHDGQRRWPKSFRPGDVQPGTLVIVDGYEQLSRWSRLRLRWVCARRRLGLLVTAHAAVGLPTLWETSADAALAERLVGALAGDQAQWLARADLGARLQRHAGNLRELFFELYDLYEARAGGGKS